MMNAFRNFFAMFASLFSAGERLANSADKLAEYCEESADFYLEEQRIERKARIDKRKAELKSIAKLPSSGAA